MVKLDQDMVDSMANMAEDDFAPLPEDSYNVMIVDEAIKETKKGDGSYLEIVLVVVDGECKGRKIWDRLNLWNPNPEARKIAQKTLTAITRAVGLDVATLEDTATLHNLPLSAKIVVDEYQDRKTNKVKSYAPKKSVQVQANTGNDDIAPF